MGIMPIYHRSPIVFPETPTGQVLSDNGTFIDPGSSGPHTHPPSDITGTAVVDNDARLSDARTPLTHTHPYEPANSNIQTHVTAAHAPSNAQKNSDISKAEIEAKLTGELTSHSHAGGGGGQTIFFLIDV